MLKSGANSQLEARQIDPDLRQTVLRHLDELLASQAFAGSRRSLDFLRFVVLHALKGDYDSLRERMIGAELFGRPVSYDTGSDSVVRVRASELRKKLNRYYSTECAGEIPLRIELPSGSYVPHFCFANEQERPAPQTATPEAEVKNPPAAADAPPQKRFSRRQIWLLVAVLGTLLLGVSAYIAGRAWQKTHTPLGAIHAVAILPLENLSGVASQEYFADGMTEELINDLGQVSTLRVISLTSSMSYKGSKKTLPQIARELGVDAVVEGGVLREGDQVRISTQLIDGRTDRPLWAHTNVRPLNSDLAWQGEVAQAIAEEVSTAITPQEQARLTRKRPLDPQAQDLYLHGLLLRENNSCAQATDYFNRALQRDPGYAQAHSALASCYGMMGESGHMPYREAFTRQNAEASRAVELDDSLSEAHAELANSAMTLAWNWPRAEAEFRRALELNSNSATSHLKYAFYLVRTGHQHEALTEVERAVELDPVSASTLHSEAFIYYFSRQYSQALSALQTAQGLKLNLSDRNFLIGDVQVEKGSYAEAIADFLKAGKDPYTLGHLGNAYARAGKTAEAHKTIAELKQRVLTDGVGRYEIALVYAGLGDKTEALKWLDEAAQSHDVGLVYLNVDPCLDPLRSEAQFNSLLARVGLR